MACRRGASAADIKSAFRKAAKKLHPDANKDDPKAAGRFAEVNSAYEIVGDADKRKQFDRGEIDAEGKPRFQGFGGNPGAGGFNREGFENFNFRQGSGPQGGFAGGGIDDILRGMFGGRAQRGGPQGFDFEDAAFPDGSLDVSAAIVVTLEEAALGAQKRIRLPNGRELDIKIPQASPQVSRSG